MALVPVILVIAATDSSGGAGIASDIKTASFLNVSTALAVTAMTAQTHEKVLKIRLVPSQFVVEQLATALKANSIRVVKIGMTGRKDIIKSISIFFKNYPDLPIIFDPVLAASSGKRLFHGSIRASILHNLLPLVKLITPNLAELAYLTGCEEAKNREQAIKQGEALIRLGASSVLVKGGHAKGAWATDYLVLNDLTRVSFSHKRLNASMRGTGCILSTAISANLALGFSLYESVGRAKQHLFEILQRKVKDEVSSLMLGRLEL
ncbi:MAG: hydroxymethylpyrimidine/phosphomethylpyrimidine kinase [Candidatus Tokpelaia sp. JSC161]|jgi:hydroxymethylpyrimidine/phosphomethylpyrimidine kinase|nr:MAG: hydroxymethylpyrimidine/phosphomethylpyrimidine kinase [Candidatus Tokpelaia sp. JSC161]